MIHSQPRPVCTLTIFGRPLAAIAPGDADKARSYIELDDCLECAAYTRRVAERAEQRARAASSTR